MLALGIADHEVTQAEIEKGEALQCAAFQLAGHSLCLAANLKKGDIVEIALSKTDEALLHQRETLAEDQATLSAASGQARRAGRRLARSGAISPRSRSPATASR